MILSTTDLMEIAFNIVYLIIIYVFVIFMAKNLKKSDEKAIAQRYLLTSFY